MILDKHEPVGLQTPLEQNRFSYLLGAPGAVMVARFLPTITHRLIIRREAHLEALIK